jgi:hypothetical protein
MYCRLGSPASGSDPLATATPPQSEEECAARLAAGPQDPTQRANLLRTPLASTGRLGTDPKAFASIEDDGGLPGRVLSGMGLAAPQGREAWRKADMYPDETARVLRLRDEGKTTTVGDPVGRASLVFGQTGGTCAIASQVEVVAGSMKTPPTKEQLKGMEDDYYKRASESYWFGGDALDSNRRAIAGTPVEYVGNLLTMPAKKHFQAGPDELDQTVSTGKMVIVGTDAGKLWNDHRLDGAGHAVVITGAELDNSVKPAKVLGYYINDTGTLPPNGGRFVTAQQFRSAYSRFFIEPL